MRTHRSIVFLALTLVALLAGSCGDQRAATDAAHQGGKDWLVAGQGFHGESFRQAELNCASCHDLAASCTQCHFDLEGSKQPAGVSPGDWSHDDAQLAHRAQNLFTTAERAVCTACHQTMNEFTGSPSFTDCSTSSCHPGLEIHAVPWPDHASADEVPGACVACHGAAPGDVDPTCGACHTADPLANADCTSCHSAPPTGEQPVGDQYPNRGGAHAIHSALAGIGCTSCHPDRATAQGYSQHYADAEEFLAPATVSLEPTYQAQTGTLGFQGDGLNGGTCSAVSCHGGQTAPNWLNGSIAEGECTACHQARDHSEQANGYFSGEHSLHVDDGLPCVDCHNTTTLADQHFSALDTLAMEGDAAATIGGGDTEIGSGEYNGSTGTCNPSCHGPERW